MNCLLKVGDGLILLARLGFDKLKRGFFNAYKKFPFANPVDQTSIGVLAAGSIFCRES